MGELILGTINQIQ